MSIIGYYYKYGANNKLEQSFRTVSGKQRQHKREQIPKEIYKPRNIFKKVGTTSYK